MKYLLEFLIFTDLKFKSNRAMLSFLGKPITGDILKNYRLKILFSVFYSLHC